MITFENPDLTVLKVGGSLLEPEQFPKWIQSLAVVLRREPAILVHGGGKEISQMAQTLKLETRFVNGRRYTDEKMIEVVEMVLSGKVNAYVAGQLRKAGVPAVGLSGRADGSIRAVREKDLGFVGIPKSIRDTSLLKALLSAGKIPVLSSLAEDTEGHPLNVNGDEMASCIAVGMRARRLILFTDVPGILDAEKKTIPSITLSEGRFLIRKKIVTGGMIPKVESAFRALQKGVQEIWILKGELPLKWARGTVITKQKITVRHPFQ